MNMPQGMNPFLFGSNDSREMDSVESAPLLRILRPATFALWFVIFAASAQVIVTTGEQQALIILALATVLFAVVHLQFWYEESERGRRLHYQFERMRGRIYEDTVTAMPNSRHFVFELRRQMMRSVRNGRGFTLILTDIAGWDLLKKDEERLLPQLARGLRQALGDGDFVARLQGPIFAAIVTDDRERSAAQKADWALSAIASCIPVSHAGTVRPVISATGYEGELEVRDYLRRAQRDLLAAQSRSHHQPLATPERRNRAA